MKSPLREMAQAHVSPDREANAVLEGALFELDLEVLPQDERLAVYVQATGEGRRILDTSFDVLQQTGFGKKATTGLGAFVVEGVECCDSLTEQPGHNAFVALSHFIPAEDDPTDGHWRLHVTYPKFHASPFAEFLKGSLLMMTPGSWFRTGGQCKPWYGRMVPMPREPDFPNALHHAMCVAAPVRMP